uniref:SEFIR domain-containing protein n=1 Tax=Parastrongyloides trichosuri TaxID=131310 RepID=A0A0N4ZDG1_PARTI
MKFKTSNRCSSIILIFLIFTFNIEYSNGFNKDCTVHHYKDISCHVTSIDCENRDIENYFYVPLKRYPQEAHDFRVEPFSIMETGGDTTKYILNVGLSWQMPPSQTTTNTKGFFLEVKELTDEEEEEHFCFFFNISTTIWNEELLKASPRFQLTSDKKFSFNKEYNISIMTLPSPKDEKSIVSVVMKMPTNPAHLHAMQHLSPNCDRFSHPYANKWTAGFQSIHVLPNSRTIQVVFKGAPAQYCFEGYEVRLTDAIHSEVMYHTRLRIEEMIVEKIGDDTIFKGIVNFTNAEYDLKYIPSVLPIETATDGRCLCPVNAADPYDKQIVCSCIAAEGSPVIMKRPEAPIIQCHNCYNQTRGTMTPKDFFDYAFKWVVFVPLLLAVFLLLLIGFLVHRCYIRHKNNAKIVNIRFVKDKDDPDSNENENNVLVNNCQELCKIPLMWETKKRIIIIYNHDCEQHESTVLALANYLRAFDFDVKLDLWDKDEISENMNDYISSSMLNVDVTLIINSVGAYHRYQAKVEKEFSIIRNNSSILDSLFLSQIDHAFQHPHIVSVRFQYTSYDDILIPLRTGLQYVLPEHGPPMISNIIKATSRNDPILNLNKDKLDKIDEAIKEMQNYVSKNPNWFIQSHHKESIVSESQTISIKDESIPIKIPISLESLPNETGLHSVTEETSLISVNDDDRIEMEDEYIEQSEIKDISDSKFLGTISINIDSGVNSETMCSDEHENSNKKYNENLIDASECYLKNDFPNLTSKKSLKHLSGDSGMVSDLNNSITAT